MQQNNFTIRLKTFNSEENSLTIKWFTFEDEESALLWMNIIKENSLPHIYNFLKLYKNHNEEELFKMELEKELENQSNGNLN